MRKKIYLTMLFIAFCAVMAIAGYGLRTWRMSVEDEYGDPVTISSFTINSAGSTAATVYSDEYKTSFTNPATSGTTVSWYGGESSYDIVATDGYRTVLNPAKTINQHRIVVPGYINLPTVNHVDANDTLTPAESGQVFVSDGHSTAAANVIFTLPGAYTGLEFIIVDANETIADDVWITCASGDTINDGTAAKSYKHITDADNHATVHIIAIDDTQWIVKSSTGTWANDNN